MQFFKKPKLYIIDNNNDMYDYDDMIQCVTILSKIQYVSIKRVLEIVLLFAHSTIVDKIFLIWFYHKR